jgi:hypothetical protein
MDIRTIYEYGAAETQDYLQFKMSENIIIGGYEYIR